MPSITRKACMVLPVEAADAESIPNVFDSVCWLSIEPYNGPAAIAQTSKTDTITISHLFMTESTLHIAS